MLVLRQTDWLRAGAGDRGGAQRLPLGVLCSCRSQPAIASSKSTPHPMFPPPGYVRYGDAHVATRWIKANDPAFWAQVARASGPPPDIFRVVNLTNRQAQILDLVARGLTNSGIAGMLGLSSTTVTTHLDTIYRRIGVHSRSEAVAWHRAQTA
jgi:DNA-binding CsgD family transcriptional regulator